MFSSRRVETREAFILELDEFYPDLILADNKLPAFEGLTALKIAKEKCPDIPFIFVTGSMGEEWAIETIKRGATDYVLKEHLSRLAPAVNRALKENRERRKRIKAEEEKRKIEAQLRQAQKMEAVGQLAGGVAHDLNNMLSTIMGYAHLMYDKMESDDSFREYMEHILEAVDRSANLVRSLLAFSRKQIIDIKPMDLNEVIKRFEGFLGRIIGEDIEFKTNMEQEKLLVVADASQIEQVLMNLATNARDAMPEGGSLTIGSGLINVDNDFCKAHGYGDPGPYALITVTDTGVGMDKETLSKIFEPFFTTKEQGKGTGLGLSIVYGIIKQHNGYVNAYSEPGKGTTFRIYIPAMRECVTIGRKEESAVTAIIGGTETVLVAEDDIALRKLSTVVLEGAGYHVISAEDGADAVEKFAEQKEEIQLCIIDMIMPRKCGKEVFDEIKKMRHNIKVLFVSGYTGDRIHKEGSLEEGFEFITKPVSPRDLLRKVREMLGSCL